jgi:hypothetical protein
MDGFASSPADQNTGKMISPFKIEIPRWGFAKTPGLLLIGEHP